MTSARPPFNPFFRLAMLAGVAFIVTILAMTASIFSDPRAPAAKWLNAHVGQLLAAEVAAVLLLSLAAMIVDRFQTLRQQPEQTARPAEVKGQSGAS